MQIITLDDSEFPALLLACKDGQEVGKYWRSGKVQVVCATRQFLMILNGENPSKIAIKPTRSFSEAQDLGLRVLKRESERGNQTEVSKLE